ncbi:hypothetical protein VQ643_12340 [Pseudomonas sp. F1_0610]|uniref:hypothetical protein n=1 Tax=Pseudomonas sp. F1_0610 TaxID=3114284 RepID=UPI0039C437B7
MSYRKPVISIWEFIRTGKFGAVALGWTTEQVEQYFFAPDDKSTMHHAMEIWRYSTFELHFCEGKLFLFWCDGLPWLTRPNKRKFSLNKGLLRNYKRLSVKKCCAELERLGLDYQLFARYFDDQQAADNVQIRLAQQQVVLHFEPLDECATTLGDYRIVALGASENPNNYKTQAISKEQL